ncbi:MAG: hypothetical protein ACI3W8_05805 [Oscillospiraceae bacterium]
MGERLNRRDESQYTAADMGRTSISGELAAVVTRGELRELETWTPGGYLWRPRQGDEVLVIKGGTAGEERCVLARAPEEPPEAMQPGEVCICTERASVFLRNDGSVTVKSGESRLKLSATGVEVESESILLRGSVQVTGSLRINGAPCCEGGCTEGA